AALVADERQDGRPAPGLDLGGDRARRVSLVVRQAEREQDRLRLRGMRSGSALSWAGDRRCRRRRAGGRGGRGGGPGGGRGRRGRRRNRRWWLGRRRGDGGLEPGRLPAQVLPAVGAEVAVVLVRLTALAAESHDTLPEPDGRGAALSAVIRSVGGCEGDSSRAPASSSRSYGRDELARRAAGRSTPRSSAARGGGGGAPPAGAPAAPRPRGPPTRGGGRGRPREAAGPGPPGAPRRRAGPAAGPPSPRARLGGHAPPSSRRGQPAMSSRRSVGAR